MRYFASTRIRVKVFLRDDMLEQVVRTDERDAAIRQLRAAYALTDAEWEREQIAKKLMELEASGVKDAAERDMKTIEARWRAELNFLARDAYLMLGPITDPFKCAGPASALSPDCQRNWTDALAAPPAAR